MLVMEAGTAEATPRCARAVNTLLLQRHIMQFDPIAVETMGVYGGSAGVILRAIGSQVLEGRASLFRSFSVSFFLGK